MYGQVWKFLLGRFFDRDRTVPQVAMFLEPGETKAASDTSSEATVKVEWTIRIKLFNETSAAAADLGLVWTSGEPSFKAVLPYHLNPFEEKVVTARGETPLARQKVEGVEKGQLFENLLEELQATKLYLTYRDEKGAYFHTTYQRSHGQEETEFKKNLPD
jgi:hypothetical protein